METVNNEKLNSEISDDGVTEHSKADKNFYPGYGWDFDLDETTCSAETLAYLTAPDDERKLGFETWKEMYANSTTYRQLNAEAKEVEYFPNFFK